MSSLDHSLLMEEMRPAASSFVLTLVCARQHVWIQTNGRHEAISVAVPWKVTKHWRNSALRTTNEHAIGRKTLPDSFRSLSRSSSMNKTIDEAHESSASSLPPLTRSAATTLSTACLQLQGGLDKRPARDDTSSRKHNPCFFLVLARRKVPHEPLMLTRVSHQ